MATLAVNSNSYIRPYRPGGRIVHFAVDDSQAILLGEPVIESSDSTNPGGIDIAGSDPSTIIGFAAESITGDGTTKIPVYIANDEGEFVGHIENAATAAGTLVGLSCGLVKDTTNNIWRVDTSDTTNASVKVTEVIDVGDVNGKVVFKVLPAAREIFV